MGGELLLGGSLVAAFVSGLVAFFAPCCATVMLPSYLACATGGHRWQVLRLSLVYVAGVATVVWPLTIGVASLSALITEYHGPLFLVGGGLMVIVGVLLLRGRMWSPSLPQPRTGTDAASVFAMGLFSGAATACCAPVLAGAVALSALNGTILGGAILGGAYLLGLVAPLFVAALLLQRYQHRLREPTVTFGLAGRRFRIGLLRLVAGVAFVLMGVFVATLGAAGLADTAPGPQRAIGLWLQQRISWIANQVPDYVLAIIILGFFALVMYRTLHPNSNNRKELADGRQNEVKPDGSRQ